MTKSDIIIREKVKKYSFIHFTLPFDLKVKVFLQQHARKVGEMWIFRTNIVIKNESSQHDDINFIAFLQMKNGRHWWLLIGGTGHHRRCHFDIINSQNKVTNIQAGSRECNKVKTRDGNGESARRKVQPSANVDTSQFVRYRSICRFKRRVSCSVKVDRSRLDLVVPNGNLFNCKYMRKVYIESSDRILFNCSNQQQDLKNHRRRSTIACCCF